MKIKLTIRAVERVAPPPVGRLRIHDTEVRGLQVVILPGGTKTFILRRMVRGVRSEVVLGQWGDITIDQARQLALGARAELAKHSGRLPGTSTLKSAWEAFTAHRLPTLADRTQREYGRLWTAHLAKYQHQQIGEIDQAALTRLHARLGDTVGKTTANRVRALMSSVLHHAADRGELDRLPAMPRPYRETRRRRWLDRQEVGRFLTAAAVDPMGDYFLLLLFTGARRSEVASMRWAEVDLGRGVWMRSQKGGSIAPTVLASPAIAVLRRIGQAGEYVFPGRGRTGHLVEPKSAWSRICEAADIHDARIHDLRHTHASWMAQAGVSLQIIGGQLGHSQASTTERYSHLALAPIRAAVEAVVGEMVGGIDNG